MATRPPSIKSTYQGIYTIHFRNAGLKKTPARGKIEVSQSVGLKNLEHVTKRVTEFAESLGVPVESVRISTTRYYGGGAYMVAKRPETDAEYEKRVKEVERFNAGLKKYREDVAAVKAWEETAEQRNAEQKAKKEAAVTEAAKDQLIREVKMKLQSDATFLAALADEALSDEKFVKQLKAVFLRSM